jgi:prolyl oligopeptidase
MVSEGALLGYLCSKMSSSESTPSVMLDPHAQAQLDAHMAAAYRLYKNEPKAAILELERAADLIRDIKEVYAEKWLWIVTLIAEIHFDRKQKAKAVAALREGQPLAGSNSRELNLYASWCRYIEWNSKGSVAAEAAELFREVLRRRRFYHEQFDDLPSADWIRDRSEFADLVLSAVPGRKVFHERVSQLLAHPTVWNVYRDGDHFFYEFGVPDKAGSYVMKTGSYWKGIPKHILTPGDVPENWALMFWTVSDCRKYIAYGISEGGADQCVVRVKGIETGRHLPDEIDGISGGRVWWKGDEGFYYVLDRNVYYHKLGRYAQNDKLLFSGAENHYITVWTSGGLLFVISYDQLTDQTTIFHRPEKSKRKFREFVDAAGGGSSIQWFDDNWLYSITYKGAPLGRMIRQNIMTGQVRQVLPQGEGKLLRVHNRRKYGKLLFERVDFQHQIRCVGRKVARKKFSLPPLTVLDYIARTGDGNILVSMESPIQPPGGVTELSLKDWQLVERFKYDVPFAGDEFEHYLTHCHSFDGTKVPVYIAHKRGARLADLPVLVSAYGGFGVAEIPARFSSYNAVLLEMGCALAIPGLRGGSEYGRQWHECTMSGKRWITIKDLIACIEHLHGLGVKRERIALSGSSNGGLVVASALVQAPTAFGCAVIGNPVIDVFDGCTRYTAEYGDPALHREDMLKYAPLSLIDFAEFPATLVQLSGNDDRVPNRHGYKFFDKLQKHNKGNAPLLLRVYDESGHAGTAGWSSQGVDTLAFLVQQLGLDTSALAALVRRDKAFTRLAWGES